MVITRMGFAFIASTISSARAQVIRIGCSGIQTPAVFNCFVETLVSLVDCRMKVEILRSDADVLLWSRCLSWYIKKHHANKVKNVGFGWFCKMLEGTVSLWNLKLDSICEND